MADTFFLEILDGTIIATAAPAMAQSFGVASPDIGGGGNFGVVTSFEFATVPAPPGSASPRTS